MFYALYLRWEEFDLFLTWLFFFSPTVLYYIIPTNFLLSKQLYIAVKNIKATTNGTLKNTMGAKSILSFPKKCIKYSVALLRDITETNKLTKNDNKFSSELSEKQSPW